MMTRVKSIGLIIPLLILAACVTINVYFPAAAAESAAKTIVRDVLNTPDGGPVEAPPMELEKDSFLQDQGSFGVMLVTRVMSLLAAPAIAEANIKIDTPVIRRLRRSLKQRHVQLRPYYQSGALGLTQKGLVNVRNLGAVPLKERSRLKKLVADENNDRNALYKEIARANGHPEWKEDIRQTFARVWINEAKRNVWYQDSKGKWRQK